MSTININQVNIIFDSKYHLMNSRLQFNTIQNGVQSNPENIKRINCIELGYYPAGVLIFSANDITVQQIFNKDRIVIEINKK